MLALVCTTSLYVDTRTGFTMKWGDYTNNPTNEASDTFTAIQYVFGVPPVNPDLVVIDPSVSDATLAPGQSFTISATVENQGTVSSSSTTLRYYRSTDSTISTEDTELGTDDVSALAPNGYSPKNITVLAPVGTHWVGACVDSVSGESPTNNQCSAGVQIAVAPPPFAPTRRRVIITE